MSENSDMYEFKMFLFDIDEMGGGGYFISIELKIDAWSVGATYNGW